MGYSKSVSFVIALFLTSISAYISVTLPISEKGIPFTAQSLVIFSVAGIVRPRLFFVVIMSYLLLGIMGLPIFADGTSGWEKIQGSSGGFLYGFIFSGLAISYRLNTIKNHRFLNTSGMMILGTIVLFVFGLAHLSAKFGVAKALEYGLYPFWKMALVKALLAALVVICMKKALKVTD